MAMRNGVITTSEARFLLAAIEGQICPQGDGDGDRDGDGDGDGGGCGFPSPMPAATGEFFIDFDLAVASPHDARASALAESLEDISVFNEFTINVLEDPCEAMK